MQHIIIANRQQEPAEPGEWFIDEHGKKCRMVGSMKEYMPTIMLDGLEVENTQEAIQAFHENKRKTLEAQRAAYNQRQDDIRTNRQCPVNALQMSHSCTKDCALYRADGCAWKRRKAEKDTLGMKCPYMRKCTKDCALYEQGCTI